MLVYVDPLDHYRHYHQVLDSRQAKFPRAHLHQVTTEEHSPSCLPEVGDLVKLDWTVQSGRRLGQETEGSKGLTGCWGAK